MSQDFFGKQSSNTNAAPAAGYDPFSGLNAPGVQSRPGYIEPAKYKFTAKSFSFGPSDNPAKRGYHKFVGLLAIAQCDNAAFKGDRSLTIMVPPPPHPGVPASDEYARAINDLKCAVLAFSGVNHSDVGAVESFEKLLAEKGLTFSDYLRKTVCELGGLNGKHALCDAVNKPTRAGGNFTKLNWYVAE